MIIRFDKVNDTTDFVRKFKSVNTENNVIMRDINVLDNRVQCVISVRDDNIRHVNMHPQYRKIKFKVIDRNKI